MSSVILENGDALAFYNGWKQPTVIVSDGPYGVSGYDGDLHKADGLAEWYEPHVMAWSKLCSPFTTLWFWNTEVGWAEVHQVLKKYGWVYCSCNIWDKGVAHVAGNTNTKTLRRFPVVTEICGHYVRKPQVVIGGQQGVSAQEWLRAEWKRTKLPFSQANAACGVKNAATRKYLTPDHLWYFPPADVFELLVNFANEHGDIAGRPYFAVDGKALSGSQWERLRGKFFCPAGVTNVWNTPAVRGAERLKIDGKALHPNQKPLLLMDRIISCSSDKGDVIWEPFGGLCSASLSAISLERHAFASEIDPTMYAHAQTRLGIADISQIVAA